MSDSPEDLAAAYLKLADEALPGEIGGLYLTGSLPLGDYRPGTSDIDGVVIVASPVTDASVVQDVHAALPDKPYFDVTYLTAEDLAAPPDPTKKVVFVMNGQLSAKVGGPASPVLWSEMARQSIAVREVPGLVVHDDHQALVDYTRDNLTSYWEPLLGQLEAGATTRPDDEVLESWVIPWFVLGIPRLHALLSTGDIVSKTAAGEHALTHFPAYAELINRCLGSRAGAAHTFTVADVPSTLTFGREVIADARATAG
jgi:hypothetical protein